MTDRETYPAWLARQPIATQDRVLGKRRAQAFRAGRLKVDRYTDPPGRGMTLQELEASRPENDD